MTQELKERPPPIPNKPASNLDIGSAAR